MRTRRRRIATVATCAAVALAGAAGPFPGTARAVGTCSPDPGWGTVRADLAAQVVALVNAHRAARGLTMLAPSASLNAAALWKARHMAAFRYMTHDDPAPPVARSAEERFAACGYPTARSGFGENIAYGYATAEAAASAWVASPAHRANLENPLFRTMGVAAAAAADGTLYWAQTFGIAGVAGGSPPPPPPPPPRPAPPAPAPGAQASTPSPPASAIAAAPRPSVAPSRRSQAGSAAQALADARPRLTPRSPRAGRRTSVRVSLRTDPSTAGVRLRCKARAGGTRLRLLAHRVRPAAGRLAAVCTWRVPRRADGRVLRVTVRLRSGRKTVKRTLTRRIH